MDKHFRDGFSSLSNYSSKGGSLWTRKALRVLALSHVIPLILYQLNELGVSIVISQIGKWITEYSFISYVNSRDLAKILYLGSRLFPFFLLPQQMFLEAELSEASWQNTCCITDNVVKCIWLFISCNSKLCSTDIFYHKSTRNLAYLKV